MPGYDSILVVAFGGPEGPDDVLPFLENVLRGKNVPRERMFKVAEHYWRFGGVSPLNAQVRALIAALVSELNEHGVNLPVNLPVYWGNRNWHPLLVETLAVMAQEGAQRTLALVLSGYSSYSSCRQYLEDIERARQQVGERAPQVDKIRAFHNHPGFVEAQADRIAAALEELPAERRELAPLIYTAHSIPSAMAEGCRYEEQLMEACRLVSEKLGRGDWRLVYQSRSGPPTQRWLGPDICDFLRELYAEQQPQDVLVAPIGFLSDHFEVLYDLDSEAREVCRELGINMVRAGTVGNHPAFIKMLRLLIEERVAEGKPRLALGPDGPSHDVCAVDCCPSGREKPVAKAT